MATVLISGASRGLGRAMAAEFAARGDRVFGGVRSDCVVPKGVEPITLNLRDEQNVENAVRSIADQGPIDIIINNAGIHIGGPLCEMSQDDFKHVLDVNVLGAWRLTRSAVHRMRSGGIVVMISSLSGLVGLPDDGAYAASKFALEGMSQSLAAELAPLGIRVIVIEPGKIKTGFAGGDDGVEPVEIARQIVSIVEEPGRAMRHPVGDQAQKIAAQLKSDKGTLAEALVLDLTGGGWQPALADKPNKQKMT